MYHSLKAIMSYPSWHVVKKYMPEAFKSEYPNTRLIIEFSVDSSSLLSQASTFSAKTQLKSYSQWGNIFCHKPMKA